MTPLDSFTALLFTQRILGVGLLIQSSELILTRRIYGNDGALAGRGDVSWLLALRSALAIWLIIAPGGVSAVVNVVLLVTLLHAVEATIWSIAYVRLEALPDYRIAMLYSLNAITSYGHVAIDLAPHWQMMGALEALNGMILFGLTTAFLFGAIHKISPIGVTRA